MEAAMNKTRKRLLAILLLVALVQLSCEGTEFYDDRSERQKDRDDCEDRGGIWHDSPMAYCELPKDSNPPAPPAASADNPTPTITQLYDIALCDAREVVELTITLEHDETSAGGRFCWYDLAATNTSAQMVAFYVYENRADHEGRMEPRWSLMYLDPGETGNIGGNGTFLTNDQWSYVYLERAAAVYYDTDYCGFSGLGIDYNDEASTAEQFDWDIDEIYCQR
jgi:hypothetical protein